MELFALPSSLLASIASYLEAESLVELDSAVCNRQARPILLDAFTQCHVYYDRLNVKPDNLNRCLWLTGKQFKISVVYIVFGGPDAPDDVYYGPQFSHLWRLCTSETNLDLYLYRSTDLQVLGLHLASLPRLKCIRLESREYDPNFINLLLSLPAKTPIEIYCPKDIPCRILPHYLADRLLDSMLADLHIWGREEDDINGAITAGFDLHGKCFPHLQSLSWMEVYSPWLLQLIKACPALTNIDLTDLAHKYTTNGEQDRLFDEIAKRPIKTLKFARQDWWHLKPFTVISSDFFRKSNIATCSHYFAHSWLYCNNRLGKPCSLCKFEGVRSLVCKYSH